MFALALSALTNTAEASRALDRSGNIDPSLMKVVSLREGTL